MNENTLLDFVELRLSSPCSSRCELYISAEGQTEKLACGFLKTFLSHVRAAQELHSASATPTLRLEGPHVFTGSRRPWFTKATLERFVQYVSTPEVLERVKTIEDELVQLEQVRSIQAGCLPQVNGGFMSSNPAVERAEYHIGHQHYDDSDNSKRELLRAMDVRLAALRQEQSMALCRATAAGFDAESIEDLLAFSEYFGADHLRVACNWFYELTAKQERAADKPVVQHSLQKLPSQLPNASEEVEAGVPWKSSHMDDNFDMRGRRAVMNEAGASQCTSLALPPDEFAAASPMRPQGHSSKGLSQRASPRRRSASPLKKVQVGRFGSRRAGSVVIRSINYFSERQNKERSHIMETSSSDSEDNVKNYIIDEPNFANRSSPASARRLSVQAAINLFERKQNKEVDEVPGKQRSVKHQSRRGSLDGANSSVSGNSNLRLHGEGKDDVCAEWQERGVANLTEASDFVSDTCGLRMDAVVRSPTRYTEHRLFKLDPDESNLPQGSCLQLWKQIDVHKTAHNLKRGSSTSEDFIASELDSVKGSPVAREMLEPADSDNSRSTITSISLNEAYTERNCSVDSRLDLSTPMSLSPSASVAAYAPHVTEGPKSEKLNQSASCVERGPTHCKEGDIDSGPSGSRDFRVPSDLTIQALASLADSPTVSYDISGNEGRFYEHYRKLRDAKMMEEQHSKRAEREAKLRLMEETLDLRKAEMDARAAKLNNNPHSRTRAAKLLALKANLRDMQRVQEDGVIRQSKMQASLMKDSSRSDSSPPSPPLTPRVVKEQALTPKANRVKKVVAPSQKNATTPRSSTRAVSISPKTTPRGTINKASSQKTPASSNVSENSLSCSVPCFSDLKKENTKPSPGKALGSAPMLSKNGGTLAQPPGVSKGSLSESNGIVPFQNSSSKRALRVDKKTRARQTRQSFVIGEQRDPSPTPEEVSIVLNTQTDMKMEAPVMSKIRRSSVAPIQDVKPFLRKGSGIGPGAGPGIMKLKAEAVKSSDEDAPGTPMKVSDEEAPVSRNIMDTSDGESILMEGTGAEVSCPSSYENEDKKVEAQALETSDADATHHSDGGFFASCGEAKFAELSKDDELFENERASHTISFPIDLGTHERFAATFASEPDSIPHAPRDEVARKGEPSATLSQLLSEGVSQVVQNESSASGSASFRANLATEEQYASRFSPLKAASLASSSLKRLGAAIPDYFSPSSAATVVESPIGSPASWNSSHVQYASETDAARSQKKLGSSQKPVVMIVPPKEPARGFKRLLKFGRKSRAAPEIIITDGVSASTPSEGDDDTEEVNKEGNMHSAHDLLRKVKLQERLLKDYGIAGANGSYGNNSDTGPVQSLQSSIAPSTFKLHYDHAPGTSKLKAPRSFFSLSTFRSRGSEGKSR